MSPDEVRTSLQGYSTLWAETNVLGLDITADLVADAKAEATLVLTETSRTRAFGGRVMSKTTAAQLSIVSNDVAIVLQLVNDLSQWALETLDLPMQQGTIEFDPPDVPGVDTESGVAIAAATFTLETLGA